MVRKRSPVQIRLAAPFTDIPEQAEAPGMSFFDAANRHRNSDAHAACRNCAKPFPIGVRYSGRNFCVLTNPVSSSIYGHPRTG